MRHPANSTLAAMQQILLPWPPDFLLNSWGCIGSDCPSPFADGWMRNRLSIMNHDVDHYWQWLTAHWSKAHWSGSLCIFNAHWSSNMSRMTGKKLCNTSVKLPQDMHPSELNSPQPIWGHSARLLRNPRHSLKFRNFDPYFSEDFRSVEI